jgi:hypothetical protein
VNDDTGVPDQYIAPRDDVLRPPESVYTKPTREQVVSAIVGDPDIAQALGYTPDEKFANELIDAFLGLTDLARQSLDKQIYVGREFMASRLYQGFDAVLPHGEMPAAGSTGDLVSQLVLDPEKNEIGIWHDLVQHHCGFGLVLNDLS